MSHLNFLNLDQYPIYALKPAIEKDLERLAIIKRVTYSDWATPIVPVPKADGAVRICGDYKVTINQHLKS